MLTYADVFDYQYCKLDYPLLHVSACSRTYATHALKEAVESSTAALRRMLKRCMLAQSYCSASCERRIKADEAYVSASSSTYATHALSRGSQEQHRRIEVPPLTQDRRPMTTPLHARIQLLLYASRMLKRRMLQRRMLKRRMLA